MKRDIHPADLAERLRAALHHLTMTIEIIRAGDLSANGLSGYRDRMAASGAVSAGIRELAEVWSWVTQQSHDFRHAFARAQLLHSGAWSDSPLEAREMSAAVAAVEIVLAGVDPALEGIDRA